VSENAHGACSCLPKSTAAALFGTSSCVTAHCTNCEATKHFLNVRSPAVFGRNSQCQPVRGVDTREECHWSHAWQSSKRSKGMQLNGILEYVVPSTKTRTVPYSLDAMMLGSRGTWLLEREEHRTIFPRCDDVRFKRDMAARERRAPYHIPSMR
jgi:hypothetical protein